MAAVCPPSYGDADPAGGYRWSLQVPQAPERSESKVSEPTGERKPPEGTTVEM